MKKGIVKSWKITTEQILSRGKVPTEVEYIIEFDNVEVKIKSSNINMVSHNELLIECATLLENILDV